MFTWKKKKKEKVHVHTDVQLMLKMLMLWNSPEQEGALGVTDRDTVASITALGGGRRVQSKEHRAGGQVDGQPGGRR